MWKMILLLAVLVGGTYLTIQYATSRPDKTPKTGLEGYTGGLQRAEDKARNVMHQENAANARNAVERYHGEKGAYPPSLQDCVDGGYLERVPQGVTYDPATGQVSETP